MSLEEELVELSLAYHGIRAHSETMEQENESLRQLVKEYHDIMSDYVEHGNIRVLLSEVKALQQRAKELLGDEE